MTDFIAKPVQEKTFFRLIVHAYDTENDLPVLLALHKESEYKKGEPFAFAAGRIMPGETDEPAVKKALKEDFGIESFSLRRIAKDSFGTDKQGRQIPRLAYHIDADTTPLQGKIVYGMHASWILCDDCREESENEKAFAKTTADQLLKALREQYDVDLDYSKASLDKLEGLIDTIMREKRLDIPFPVNVPIPLSLYIGSYLGTLLVQELGGSWVRKFGMSDVENADGTWSKGSEWAVKLSGSPASGPLFANPMGKARKRVKNGAEDSLSFFYEGIQAVMRGKFESKF